MKRLLDRPELFLATASLVFGLALAAVTPPFQVPDEPAHFYRAYLVSEGELRWVPSETNREEVPASLVRLTATLIGDLLRSREAKIAPRTILDAFAVPLAPAERVTAVFPTGLQYTFVAYLPQAIGIAVGRLFGAPALALLYAARLANLVAGTLAMVAAIRMLPALRWPAVLLAMMPMPLALRASASADTTAIAAAFLLTAAAARLTWGAGAPRRRDVAVLTAAALVLCASKPPYLPLAFLVFLVPRARWPLRRPTPSRIGLLAVLAAVITWSLASARAVGVLRPDAGVDPDRQVAVMIAAPLRFLGIVAADYVAHTPRYVAHFVGHLGWLDTRPPIWLLVAYIALLLSVTIVDAGGGIEVTVRQRAILASIALCGLLLVSASQYVTFTPVGAAFIDGLQGRHYLPLALAGMWALRRGPGAASLPVRSVPAAVAIAVVVAYAVVVRTLLERFYGV